VLGQGREAKRMQALPSGSPAILSAVEEIRPQGTGARRLVPVMGGLSALGLLILASSLAMHRSGRTEGIGGTMFAIGALGVAYLLLWLRNARLLAGSGLIGQRNLLGRASVFQTAGVGRLLIATVVYSKNSTPQRALYVFTPSGQTLMTLNARAWGDEAIAKIVDATGKSIEYRDAPISLRAFKTEFPRAVNRATSHPNLLGGGIVIVAMVLAIGIPIAWAVLSKQ
jgi:hypothetical protein